MIFLPKEIFNWYVSRFYTLNSKFNLYPPDKEFFALQKNLFLFQCLYSNFKNLSSKSIIDFGCGIGINLLILKNFDSKIKCFGIDRFTEFEADKQRYCGSFERLISIHDSFGSLLIKADPVTERLNQLPKVNLTVSYDVIEHLPYQANRLIENMAYHTLKSGTIHIATPNQVSLINRIKSLLGKNTWENYDHWFNDPEFYGHIRELTYYESFKSFKSISSSPTNVYVFNLVPYSFRKVYNYTFYKISSFLSLLHKPSAYYLLASNTLN